MPCFAYNCLPCLDSLLWLSRAAETKCHEDMSFFHSDSKTELNLLCDYCIKFQLFKGAQDVLLDWQLRVACYWPTTPTEPPSTTRGTSAGPPVAVKINFYGYLWFLSICFAEIYGYSMSLKYMGTVCHWKHFWSKINVRFISQCWYFNPQWTPVRAVNKSMLCLEPY